MMGTRSLPASIQPSSDWSRGWPGSDWAMLVPMHTGLVDLHSSFARSRRSRNGVGFDLSGAHRALFPGGRHGTTVDTENAETPRNCQGRCANPLVQRSPSLHRARSDTRKDRPRGGGRPSHIPSPKSKMGYTESCSRIYCVGWPSASGGFGCEDVRRSVGKIRPYIHPDRGRDRPFQPSTPERSTRSSN